MVAMKPKALLVEDNENNRYLAQFLLERDGFAVTVAVDGKQALEAARLHKPDVVLMDIQMPDMDGYQTAEQFKAVGTAVGRRCQFEAGQLRRPLGLRLIVAALMRPEHLYYQTDRDKVSVWNCGI